MHLRAAIGIKLYFITLKVGSVTVLEHMAIRGNSGFRNRLMNPCIENNREKTINSSYPEPPQDRKTSGRRIDSSDNHLISLVSPLSP